MMNDYLFLSIIGWSKNADRMSAGLNDFSNNGFEIEISLCCYHQPENLTWIQLVKLKFIMIQYCRYPQIERSMPEYAYGYRTHTHNAFGKLHNAFGKLHKFCKYSFPIWNNDGNSWNLAVKVKTDIKRLRTFKYQNKTKITNHKKTYV